MSVFGEMDTRFSRGEMTLGQATDAEASKGSLTTLAMIAGGAIVAIGIAVYFFTRKPRGRRRGLGYQKPRADTSEEEARRAIEAERDYRRHMKEEAKRIKKEEEEELTRLLKEQAREEKKKREQEKKWKQYKKRKAKGREFKEWD